MPSPRARTLLMGIAIFIAAVGFFPGVTGYAWAIGWLPIYGLVCHFDKVVGPAINPDGYRVYLLDRGCDVDAAIRNILAGSQFAAGQDKVDADRIIGIYHHRQVAETGDESLARDLVQEKLSEYATSAPVGTGCAPDDRYCSLADAAGDNFMSEWVHAYLSYVQSQFRYTVIDAADYITSLLAMGLIAQVIIGLCYLAAMLFFTGRIVRYVIRGSAVTRRRG
jgi:hypothetical protein